MKLTAFDTATTANGPARFSVTFQTLDLNAHSAASDVIEPLRDRLRAFAVEASQLLDKQTEVTRG